MLSVQSFFPFIISSCLVIPYTVSFSLESIHWDAVFSTISYFKMEYIHFYSKHNILHTQYSLMAK